jgi:hypothetical protein
MSVIEYLRERAASVRVRATRSISPTKRDRALSVADHFERMAADLDRGASASTPPFSSAS